MAPKLTLFRSYFPAMDAERHADVIDVPKDMFVPVHNIRRLIDGAPQSGVCAQPSDGGIDHVLSDGATLTIDGWAPWTSETDTQEARIESARSVRPDTLSTIMRPDIAERLQDYGFVKSGFRLQISSTDGKPLRPANLALVAFGTSYGQIRLSLLRMSVTRTIAGRGERIRTSGLLVPKEAAFPNSLITEQIFTRKSLLTETVLEENGNPRSHLTVHWSKWKLVEATSIGAIV